MKEELLKELQKTDPDKAVWYKIAFDLHSLLKENQELQQVYKVSYEELQKIVSQLDNLNEKELPVFPDEVKVNNLEDIRFPNIININQPDWLKNLKSEELNLILGVLNLIRKNGIKAKIESSATNPVSVRLSSGRDFYNAVSTAVSQGIIPFVDSSGNRVSPQVDANKNLQVNIQSPLESNGAVPVNIQDQTSEIIDLYFHENLADVTLATNTSIGDKTVTLTAGHGTQVGEILCFKESGRYTQCFVLVVATNTITLDTPLDFAYTTGASVHRAEQDLGVDGSSTTQIYHISPPAGVKWDIVRNLFYIQDDSAMADDKFGGITALTNGVVLRLVNGVTKNVFNVKTNGEFAERAYDVTYTDKAPAGEYGVRIRRTYGGQDKNGVVLRVDGDAGDSLQILIQDDLTALTHFHAVAQGHVVTD